MFAYNGICPYTGYQFENPPLDSSLWNPYSSWMEKIRDLYDKKNIEELNIFIDKLWAATKEFGRKRDEEWKRKYEDIKKNNPFQNSNNGDNNFYETNNKENDNYIDKGKFGDEILDKLKTSKVSDSDLDSSLWSPYELWAEKLVSLTSESEIETFKSQMFSAIDKAKIEKLNKLNSESNIPSDNGKQPIFPSKPNHTPPKNIRNFQKNSSQNDNSFWNKFKVPLLVIFFSSVLGFFVILIINKVRRRKKL